MTSRSRRKRPITRWNTPRETRPDGLARPAAWLAALAAALIPAAVLAGSQENRAASETWQKSHPEKRATSGNPKLSWGKRADSAERRSGDDESSSADDSPAKKSGPRKASSSAKPHKRVVPAAHRQNLSKLRAQPTAAPLHKDEAVEPAAAPLLRSALPAVPDAELEPEEGADNETDGADELPEIEAGPDMPGEESEPRTLDETEDSAPLSDPADDLFLPERSRPRTEELPPNRFSPDRLKPEPMPARGAHSAAAEECERECPLRTDPRMFRHLSEISLNLADPRRTIEDAPSDYVDEQGRGPDHPDFAAGEKFIPRRSFRRCWTDANGSKFIGWFYKLEDGKILVMDEDGEEHWIPRAQISFRDVRYLYHLPGECLVEADPFIPRQWCQTTFTWKASCLCHKPLYFEQVNFERYGHTWGPFLDPVMSGAHFFVSTAFLPYSIGIEPPQECVYSLGYYRPNSCAPYMLFPVPLSWRGAWMQARVMTGTYFMFNP